MGGWGLNPQFMSTDTHFWVKIGLKFQSLGKISNISAADPPPPISFRSIPTLPILYASIVCYCAAGRRPVVVGPGQPYCHTGDREEGRMLWIKVRRRAGGADRQPATWRQWTAVETTSHPAVSTSSRAGLRIACWAAETIIDGRSQMPLAGWFSVILTLWRPLLSYGYGL